MLFKYNSKSASDEIVAGYRWKKRIRKGCVQWIRVGKHLLYKNKDLNGRWLIIPLNDILKKGKECSLRLKYQTNFDKKFGIYLLGKDNTTQLVGEFESEQNQWTELIRSTKVNLDECNRIFITATDFVLSSEVLTIAELEISSR